MRNLISRMKPEARECAAYCQRFELQFPKLWPDLIHVANERRHRIENFVAKLLGVKPGVSDYLLAVPIGGYQGMWLEAKKTGATWSHVDPDQRVFRERRRAHGYFTAVGFGLDHMWEITLAYINEQPLDQHWAGSVRSVNARRAKETD